MAREPFKQKSPIAPRLEHGSKELEFKSIEEEDAWIIKHADQFRAYRFHGRGMHETIGPYPTLDQVINKIKERGKNEDPRRTRGWLVYAVVTEGSRQTNVLSLNCRGEKEEDYDEFRKRIKREEKLARKHRSSKNG